VSSVSHIFGTLRRVLRRGEEDDVVAEARERMETIWSSFDGYFAEVADRYDTLYLALLEQEEVAKTAETINLIPTQPTSDEEEKPPGVWHFLKCLAPQAKVPHTFLQVKVPRTFLAVPRTSEGARHCEEGYSLLSSLKT
jgi:hypothetical protein